MAVREEKGSFRSKRKSLGHNSVAVQFQVPFGSSKARFTDQGLHPMLFKSRRLNHDISQLRSPAESQPSKKRKSVTSRIGIPSGNIALGGRLSYSLYNITSESEVQEAESVEKRLSSKLIIAEKQKTSVVTIPKDQILPYNRIKTKTNVRIWRAMKREKALGANVKGLDWKKAEKLQLWSRIPYVMYYDQWYANLKKVQTMSPNKYKIPADLFDRIGHRNTPQLGVLHNKEPRFMQLKDSIQSGPPPYDFPAEKLPTFKSSRQVNFSDSLGDRSPQPVGSGLPPGLYYKAGRNSIDELVKKVVSLKGPYDVFHGERFAPLRIGWFGKLVPEQFIYTAPPYDPPTFAEMLNRKPLSGVFNVTPKGLKPPSRSVCNSNDHHWVKPIGPPASKYYPKYSVPKVHKHRPPFNSSTRRLDAKAIELFYNNLEAPGVGRYNLKSAFGTKSGKKTGEGSPDLQRKELRSNTAMQIRVKPMNLSEADKKNLILVH